MMLFAGVGVIAIGCAAYQSYQAGEEEKEEQALVGAEEFDDLESVAKHVAEVGSAYVAFPGVVSDTNVFKTPLFQRDAVYVSSTIKGERDETTYVTTMVGQHSAVSTPLVSRVSDSIWGVRQFSTPLVLRGERGTIELEDVRAVRFCDVLSVECRVSRDITLPPGTTVDQSYLQFISTERMLKPGQQVTAIGVATIRESGYLLLRKPTAYRSYALCKDLASLRRVVGKSVRERKLSAAILAASGFGGLWIAYRIKAEERRW